MNDFAPRLIAWQRCQGRHDLPWQGSRDPYRVWLSEIMLQQTQVSTVIPYYERFLARFPDLASLAAAEEQEVLALWSGLGYYARGRNLHKAAQRVQREYGGVFPRSREAVAELPGIGRSTAAAIVAFAYGERAAILDGNVKRVLTRIFGIDGFPGEKAVESRLWALAEKLLPAEGIEAYTQGLMDLGATLCTRGRPACAPCPFHADCQARIQGRQSQLPTPRPKRLVPQKTARMLVLLAQDGAVYLEQRPPAGIWGGLWALPTLPEALPDAEIGAWVARHWGFSLGPVRSLETLSHAFTHFRLDIQPRLCTVLERQPALRQDDLIRVAPADLADAPLPAPVRRILSGLMQPGLFSA